MIIITGASDGLGFQLAKIYNEAGEKIVNISRHESEYAHVNILISLEDSLKTKEAVSQIAAMNEKIKAIIHCAGAFSQEKLGNITEQEIDRVMSVNINAAILLTSLLSDRIQQDETDIVNIASAIGFKAYASQAVYGASKWAMRGFSKNLQEEFKDKPNRVISFCPGGIKTKLFEKALGEDITEDGRSWMQPNDVAKFIKQILDLPKSIEVSEVVLSRK